MLSPEKAAALKSQIDKLVELGVLRESQQGHYSHAHLVAKKPTGWRFTCDFRELNDQCEAMRWPIPNIPDIFNRIWAEAAKIFRQD